MDSIALVLRKQRNKENNHAATNPVSIFMGDDANPDDEPLDLTNLATKNELSSLEVKVDGKAELNHNHDTEYSKIILSGSAEPTSSTAGELWQFYACTTGPKLFQCTSIVESVYTWTEVGTGSGGGGSSYFNGAFYSNVVILAEEASTFVIGIVEFDAETDKILIYQGGLYQAIPEEITVTNTTATKVSGTWASGTTFDILVIKQASTINFLGLYDTPDAYTDMAGKIVKVNATEDGLEFGEVSSGDTYYENPIDEPPASPSVWDDEFNVESLDPKWSWVNQGTSAVTVSDSHVFLDAASGVDVGRGIIQVPPTGDFTAIAKINMEAFIENYYGFGIGFFNSANNRMLHVGKRHNAGNAGIWWIKQTTTSWGAEGLWGGYGATKMYVKIQRVGTTLKLSYSNTGLIWQELLSEGVSVWMGAVTGIGLLVFRNNSNASHKQIGMCDWFRVTEG